MQRITLIANHKLKNLPAIAERHEILEEGVAARLHHLPAAAEGVDLIVENSPKHKKLLVCDMESTIIENEFLDEIAAYLGIKKQVEEITARAMNGELDFKESLHKRIHLIMGLTKSEAMEIAKTKLKYNDGAHELLAAMRKNGVHTMLVSGGFTMFTEIVAHELGFNEHHANELIFENDLLIGVKEPILGKDAKLELMTAKCKELGIGRDQAIAIGDGANDLPMLHAAGLGIAYKAKPKVREEIKNQINYSDLSALRFLI